MGKEIPDLENADCQHFLGQETLRVRTYRVAMACVEMFGAAIGLTLYCSRESSLEKRMSLYYIGLIGVFVFAASGALAAGRKSFDLMGVAVISVVTAIGGGTTRDVLLDRRVFWISDPIYLWVALAGGGLTILYARRYRAPLRALLVADALGLALFGISGTQIAEENGLTGIIAVLMGMLTGVAGGVFRDLLTAEIPFLCRSSETLYATPIILGASIYLLLKSYGVETATAALCGMSVIAALRLAAIFWNWRLPAFVYRESETPPPR